MTEKDGLRVLSEKPFFVCRVPTRCWPASDGEFPVGSQCSARWDHIRSFFIFFINVFIFLRDVVL